MRDSAAAGSLPRFACIIIDSDSAGGADRAYGALLTACRLITTRVEALSPYGALLDLGPHAVTAAEAERAIATIRTRLAACGGVHTSAGIGPTLVLAQFAAYHAHNSASRPHITPHTAATSPVTVLTAEAVPSFLDALPVVALLDLRPRAAVTDETIQQFRRYGVTRLGQLARLGEAALRTHFGESIGRLLFAAASGWDWRPLCPTPPARQFHFRLRLSSPLAPDHLIAALAPFAARAAVHLHVLTLQASMLHLRVRWERGGEQLIRQVLHEPTADPDLLARQLRRLLTRLLSIPRSLSAVPASMSDTRDLVSDLSLTLSDLVPAQPAQHALWRWHNRRELRLRRLETIAGAAETITRRHGRPILYSYSRQIAIPDAIFHEQRYVLTPFAGDVSKDTSDASAPNHAPTRTFGHAGKALPRPHYPVSQPDVWEQIPHCLHWW